MISQCKARRQQDEMHCGRCGLTWDVKDPGIPGGCLARQDHEAKQQRGRKALDEMRRKLASVVIWYLLIYTLITLIDEDHCRRYGAEYHSTSLGLTGYCSVSGVKVPAEWIGRD